MRQAILITTHKDLDFLQRIIDHFDADFDFFVHVDKKCKEHVPMYHAKGDVITIKTHHIEWGSDRLLYAIYDLLRLSTTHGNYCYYHLITGSDYPIKTAQEFKDFFTEQNNNNFIEYHSIPREGWGVEGGVERLRYYWIGNQYKDIRFHGELTRLLLKIQRKIGMHRPSNLLGDLYCGGIHCSLNDDGVKTLMNIDSKLLRKVTHFTHACEEIIPHTILLNSPNVKCVNNPLHLTLWQGNAASPKTLSDDDFETIRTSDAFFARKFDRIVSASLLDKIDQELLNA